ncbi:MAG: hypothetical protein ACOYB3_01325 [Azonexus sp.]
MSLPSNNAFSGVLSNVLDAVYVLSVNDAASIGVHVVPPTGGEITFEGSWDGMMWEPFTLRQMGAHGYSTTTREHEDWIGSVATFVYIRFRTSVGGSAPGNIHGRFSPMVCTLEGIEHGPQPHKIGSTVQAKDISVASTSAAEVWRPTAGHKLVISDIHFTVSSAPSTVYISEGSISRGAFIFKGKFKPPNGESVYIPVSFSLPHVFQGTESLFVTQSDGAEVEGVVHGYETEP